MVVILHILITAVSVWVATVLPGITLEGESTATKIGTLLAVAVVFGVVNATLIRVLRWSAWRAYSEDSD